MGTYAIHGPTPDLGKRAIGSVYGQDFITVEIKSDPGPCEPVAGLLNYPGLQTKPKQIVVNEIPYVGDGCKAEPVTVKVDAPPGDLFGKFPIVKVIWAAEFKNGAFSFSSPRVAGK